MKRYTIKFKCDENNSYDDVDGVQADSMEVIPDGVVFKLNEKIVAYVPKEHFLCAFVED